MRVLKWTPQFKTKQESSIVPVWIAFEGFPLHRFNAGYLSELASIVGTPQKIDVPTLNLSRPSIARVRVEVNLLQDLPRRVLLGTKDYSYYQEITYENLPEYCSEGKNVGHGVKDCCRGKPKAQPNQVTKVSLKMLEKVKIQPPVNQTNWKQKPHVNGENDNQAMSASNASSSGLSTEEKHETPIDIVDNRNGDGDQDIGNLHTGDNVDDVCVKETVITEVESDSDIEGITTESAILTTTDGARAKDDTVIVNTSSLGDYKNIRLVVSDEEDHG
ncbi:OLC1v1007848C1 [Oldenlandia corymbosa var. corymbosa]|uniref:OLC1v1007848C1 n=1 Tax=Oldenlandia corymbosa var. corymbosa TaxID=529605 RepID=A0AAV1DMQ9_OLDCO|nr:OLC1v1007848C1 [Oldenlandia corymbosa var. corymbosa]